MPCNWEKIQETGNYVTFAFTFFAIGLDYAIHLSGLYDYFLSVGASGAFFSYAIAAYSAGALISSSIWGRLFDRYKFAKLFSMIGMVILFAGSLLFTIQSKYVILMARFISGLAVGLEGAILGMVAKSASPAEKSKKITMLYALKQLGIIAGPLFVLLFLASSPSRCISKEDENGTCLFAINQFNSTGYFMMVIAVLLAIFLAIFAKYIEPYSGPVAKKGVEVRSGKNMIQIKNTGLLSEACIVGCFCTMALYSIQSTNEAILTQVTKYYLGYGTVENGYVYAISGGCSTVGYVTLVFVLKYFKERTILIFGLCVELGVSFLLLGLMGIVSFRVSWFEPLGVIGLILFSFVLSYVMASASSILAKSSSDDNQSVIQGARVGLEKLVIILSNLLAGQIYPLTNSYQMCYIFPCTFLVMAVCFIIASWKFLDPESILFLTADVSEMSGKSNEAFTDIEIEAIKENNVFKINLKDNDSDGDSGFKISGTSSISTRSGSRRREFSVTDTKC